MAPQSKQETFSNVTPISAQETFSNVTPISGQQQPSVWDVLTQPTEKTDAEYGSYRGPAGVAGATIKGLDDIGRGVEGAIKGTYNMVRHPIDTAKGIASLPSQAAQVPAAIKDINASPDPTGTYLNAAQDTASQGAGQALVALGTEGVGSVAKSTAPYAGPVTKALVKGYAKKLIPGEVGEAMKAVKATKAAAEPQPVFPGASKPAAPPPEVTQAAALYRGVKPVEDPAAGLGQIPVKSGSIAQQMAPKAIPFERGALSKLLDKQLGEATGAAPPPDPKAPIYQRGSIAKQMPQSDYFSPEAHAARDAAFTKANPPEAMNDPMPPNLRALFQESAGFEKPAEDIGSKVRAKNPEPTRAEARGAALKKELAKVSPQQAPQYSADKAIYKGSTFEHKGGQFFKDGNLLEKGDDIADAVDALEAPKGKVIEAQPVRGSIAKQLNAPDVPEGHTPVDSSALKSYKYDPQAREFHAQYNSNPSKVHIFGDVSPEEAQAFDAAKSKGTAMQAIRRNPEVARIINGKRIAVKPVTK